MKINNDLTVKWTPEQVQEEALKSREILFKDPVYGFDYCYAGARGNVRAEDEEERINSITNNQIKFIFISHRELIMYIDGNEILLRAVNRFGNYNNSNDKDSKANNPYLKIAKKIRKYINTNYNNEETMKTNEITKLANAIQEEAIKMLATITEDSNNTESASIQFENNVKKLSGDSITLKVYQSKSGKLQIDFKAWSLYNDTHSSRTPGKYNVNKVAQVIQETYEIVNKGQDEEECMILPENNQVSSSTCDVVTFIQTHTDMLISCVNIQQPQCQTTISLGMCNDIITGEIKNGTITLRMLKFKKCIDTNGKNIEEVRKEISNTLKELIMYAAISSETRDHILSVFSEESFLEVAIGNLKGEAGKEDSHAEVASQPEKRTYTKKKKYNKRSVESFNRELKERLDILYNSLEMYNPEQIRQETQTMFRQKFKKLDESDYMDILDDNNKKTLSDYYELCETNKAA